MEKKWWKEAVVYQIYPRSYMDSNGDGIGDLKGVTSRLDYIKELGVDVIWMSPCYKSPNDDNGYDISDYRDIMDEFGTMEDFNELLEGIHARGMKLLMDLVVNHSSDEHRWFLESRKSKDNPYRDYYIWRDPRDGKEPNNWTSFFSGPAWEYDEMTGQYYLHLFSRKQPDLNWENETVREEVYDIVKFWLDKGIDGFRMDVANLYSKVEGLPDGGPGHENIGTEFYQDGPRIHEFHHEMYEKVTSKYDIMTVGEMSGVPLEEAVKYVGNDREELNMVFQFDQNLIDGGENDHWAHRTVPLPELKAVFSKWQNGLNGKGWNSLYWTNHDQPRTVSRWGNDGAYRKESQKMLYTMLLTLQGTPYIYQGEEIGMTNVSFDSIDDYDDVEIHNMWQERVVKGGADPEETLDNVRYRARDNARTPMQWDDTENAGFTTGTPWLKVNPNYKEINAKEALADPDSIFHYMQRLIRMRKSTPVAIYGDFKEYEPENESLYIYERSYEGAKLFVVLNFTDQEVTFTVPETVDASAAKLLISNYDGEQKLTDGKLLPYEGQVYLIQ
ncbi:MAG: alpha-glucosidase [Clostridiales bacterium]|nr:alpha-glucosidase [Clostridiales bacterium]